MGSSSRGPRWFLRRFGVGRSVVREAIAGLGSDGVEQNPRAAGHSQIKAVALAALRADDDQRARITEALHRMKTAANWLDDGVTADLEFHRCGAAASGNLYIATVVAFLAEQMPHHVHTPEPEPFHQQPHSRPTSRNTLQSTTL